MASRGLRIQRSIELAGDQTIVELARDQLHIHGHRVVEQVGYHGELYRLNLSAALVLEQLREAPETTASLTCKIGNVLGVSPFAIVDAVEGCVNDLLRFGLVSAAERATANSV